jgi:hypothetical protein
VEGVSARPHDGRGCAIRQHPGCITQFTCRHVDASRSPPAVGILQDPKVVQLRCRRQATLLWRGCTHRRWPSACGSDRVAQAAWHAAAAGADVLPVPCGRL